MASTTDELSAVERFAADAVKDTLGRATDVDACLKLATRVDVLLGQALQHFEKDIACRAGCNFCCHLRVMVFPHEAVALFRYIGTRMPQEVAQGVKARALANAARIKKEDARNLPCAFLIQGRCGAYEARPAACAGYHSLSKERCEQDFNDPAPAAAGIPMLEGLHHVASALDGGLDQALYARGLSGTRVELQTALAALIRDPSLIQRWRTGRPLLPQR